MYFRNIALFVISFLLVIFLSSLLNWQVSYTVIGIFFILSAVFFIFPGGKIWMVIALVLLGSGFGFLRFSGLSISEKDTSLDFFAYEQHEITLRGYIADRPNQKQTRTDFIFQVQDLVLDSDVYVPMDTKVLVKTEPYADYYYGQELIITGIPKIPEAFETDSGRIFHYDTYLYKDDIVYTFSYANIISTGNTVSVPWLKKSLYQLKDNFISAINRYIPRPASGLLAGVLFGEKSALDTQTLDQFRIVGLMHIVVLSGYNVAIVIYAIMYLLRGIPIGVRSILAVCGIIAFALLTGAGPTVIRASFMGVFIVLSKLIGEQYDIHKALLVAAFLMVCINPKILVFDISFQLSFLATYGLIMFSPWLEKKLMWIPHWFLLRESAVATIAAQIMVLPLILYSIGEFSIISIAVNMLVLFAVPIAMLLGFGVAVLGWIGFGALVLAFPTTLMLNYILWVVDIFSQFSFSVITFPKFHWSVMVFLYIIIFIAAGRIYKQKIKSLL